MEKVTLVIGASPKPERFSNKAVKRLLKYKYPVLAIGLREEYIEKIKIRKGMPDDLGTIHTVAMYLGPANQKPYYNYILSLNPQRIIFNPGTINHEFSELAKKRGIQTVNDCVLVMLSKGRY